MSDAHNESAIRTPKQLLAVVAGFFFVTVIGIILLVSFVTTEKVTGAGSDSQAAKTINARLQPVAEVGYTFRDASAPKVLQSGEAVFTAICAACHATGAAGAPKVGDNGAWAARISQGYDTLVKHAIEGIRAMPAKGGNPDLDDLEVARAVAYMGNKSGASFKEPAAPAPAATTAAAAPAAAAGPDAAASPVAPAGVATGAMPPASAPAPTPVSNAPAATAPVAAPKTAATDVGKKLYDTTCVACHGAGIAGAPRFGDKAAWAPRIAQGNATLYDHAIKGFQGKAGVMPAKGGSTAPDADVKAAVDYMAGAAK
jgi:cytochrome c5